jgi:hypothetical protein
MRRSLRRSFVSVVASAGGLLACRAILGVDEGVLIEDAGNDAGGDVVFDATQDSDSSADVSVDHADAAEAAFDGPVICDAAIPGKLVFVTSQTYPAAFGGLSAGDAICQGLATDAGLPGTYRAWLSDDTTAAGARITPSPVPYVRPDGVLVANNFADLMVQARNAIFVTERCTPPPPREAGSACPTAPYFVWTGTLNNGSRNVGDNCSNWTDSGLQLRGGSAAPGDVAYWSSYCAGTGSGVCSGSALLYCLQQ